jgi:hypothetical protein
MPGEIRAQIRALDNADVSTLADALRNPHSGTRRAALVQLEEMVKQTDLSLSTMKEILSAVEEVESVSRVSGPEKEYIEQFTSEISWHIQIREIEGEEERLTFLRDQLKNMENNPYYSRHIIDYIIEIATDDAKALLEEKIIESKQRSMSEEFLQRLKLGTERIELLQKISNMRPSDQVEEFAKVFNTYEGVGSFPHQEFSHWLIKKLGQMDTTESGNLLRLIWQDNTKDLDDRYIAQEVLVRTHVILPHERTITFRE